MDMRNGKKQCGGIEEYQWLITLVFEAVIKVVMALLDKNKENRRPDGPDASEQPTVNQQEANDD